MTLEGKKVLMVIAPNNFRDEEYFDTKEVLSNKGAQITTASKKTGQAVGMLGGSANVDISLEDVNAADYDAVVFVGGAGASDYFNDNQAISLAKDASGQGKVLAAICIAPSILANAGLLGGKNATCFPSEQPNLESKGAVFTGEHVTRDGNLVTADGPGSARSFGNEIAIVLGNK